LSPYPEGDPADPEVNLAQLDWVKEQAAAGFEAGKRGKNPNAAAMSAFLNTIVKTSEAQHKIRMEVRRKGVPAEWGVLKDKILGALRDHPEALAAVAEAIQE